MHPSSVAVVVAVVVGEDIPAGAYHHVVAEEDSPAAGGSRVDHLLTVEEDRVDTAVHVAA